MRIITVMCVALILAAGVANAGTFQPLTKMENKPGTGGESKGTLDCTGAIEVDLGETHYGDNTGGVNNVTYYDCSYWNESGPEVVYHLYLSSPTMFIVTLNSLGTADLDLAVLDQCDEVLGCLIVVDTGVETTAPVSGDFYFVVDGYSGAAGPYELIFEEGEVHPPACDVVVQAIPGSEGQIVPEGVFPLSGSTCDSENYLGYLDCADYTENGLDNWYEITLLPGGSFTATITNSADGALWVVDACAEPIGCLAYADNTFSGTAEAVTYLNNTGGNQTVYLVVDSFGSATCGTYDGLLEIFFPGVVPVQDTSWGELKGRYGR